MARRIVEALVDRGHDTFFGVPGGPVCALFEAVRLTPGARLVASRHETMAAFAAATYQRVTERVPIVVVTAGPGITNVVTGVASAHFERTPMLVIAGDGAWSARGARVAQDSGPEGLDAEAVLASVTRAQIRVTSASASVAQVFAALHAATRSSLPGPALVVLPVDLAMHPVPALDFVTGSRHEVARAPRAAIKQALHWLMASRRPLLVFGAGATAHSRSLQSLVDALGIPFVTTPSGKGVLSEAHPLSLRHGGIAASMWARRYTAEPVDVALVLGTDLDDTSTAATPYVAASGRLIHVDRNAAVFNRNLRTALAVCADLADFAEELARDARRHRLRHPRGGELAAEIRATSPFDEPDAATDDRIPIAPHRAVLDLERACSEARFITDIGEHMLFALHYLTVREQRGFHIQLGLGSMGSGIAGGVGLALAEPSRRVVCICGDGGLQMAATEILVAAKERLPIVFSVFNDGRYNMVHHGMKQIFGDADPWDMPPVDYSALAKAMHVPSAIINAPAQINRSSIERLLTQGGPALLDIRIDASVRVRGGGRIEALQHMSMLRAAEAED